MFKREGGLTLIELMVTVALIALVLGAIWAVYNVALKAFYGQTVRGGVIPEIERTFSEFRSDLRQATSVTAAQARSVTFTADPDSNGVNETIQYVWAGSAGNPLNKVTALTRPMVHSVSSLAFSYYDMNNNLLAFPVTASQVRRVVIDITVTSGKESFTARAGTDLRCL